MFKKIGKGLILFSIGGFLYMLIEIIYRGYTHWTMGILGGLMFVLVGCINEYLPWDMSIILQSIIGSIMITTAEFIAGCILNIWLGLHIWDYSNLPGNILGQICPQFSIAWLGISVVCIVLDDYLRYFLFGEEKPHYKLI
jgi:uncharacterized membrane protein